MPRTRAAPGEIGPVVAEGIPEGLQGGNNGQGRPLGSSSSYLMALASFSDGIWNFIQNSM